MNSSKQIDIGWPLVAVFNYVCDIANNAEWLQGVAQTEWLERTEEYVGSVFAETRQENGQERSIVFTVTEYIPHRRRTIVAEDGTVLTMEFAALSATTTRLIWEVDQRKCQRLVVAPLSQGEAAQLKKMMEVVYC